MAEKLKYYDELKEVYLSAFKSNVDTKMIKSLVVIFFYFGRLVEKAINIVMSKRVLLALADLKGVINA